MGETSNNSVGESVVPGSRVRSALARFGTRAHSVPPAIEPVITAFKTNNPKMDFTLILRAYEVARRCHEGQTRKSGEPYITHPIAVATILAELGMLPKTLAAALLHDTVEDTDLILDDLRAQFGDEIALLVDGVTKLDKLQYGEAAKSETVRKMIVAMSKDIRVLFIKLADRLHNARTWKYVPAQNAAGKARETLDIYAPLAHRLGMNTIKWELEDRSFKVLYPEVYDEIEHMVAERAPAREEYLAQVIDMINTDLKENNIKGVVTGRPKHFYSIYQKMIVRGKEFDDIYDLVAVRVIVDTEADCYGVLGIVHGRWTPMPGRFKDYIASPKFNFYRSLHTTVIGPSGKPVEVQIRTHEMHRMAEYGVAAHWRYKQNPNATKGSKGNEFEVNFTSASSEMDWLRQLIDWQKDTQDPADFLDSLRFEISGNQVYVFTPKGDVQALPAKATPVDFAFSVHTEVGYRTIGAKVNGRLVPLNTVLETGDTVEIFTSKAQNAGPSRDWMTFVASPRARAKIKAWFSKERREEAIERGKDQIAKAMRKQNLPLQRIMTHDSLMAVAQNLNKGDIDGLYAAVGDSHISAQHVVENLVSTLGGEAGTEESLAEAVLPSRAASDEGKITRPGDTGVVVDGMQEGDVYVKLARCCTPMPGDPIVGFITRGNGISVHTANCINVSNFESQPERMIGVSWSQNAHATYIVQLEVEALDRLGLLADVTRAMADAHINLVEAVMGSKQRDRVVKFWFVVELAEAVHLDHVLTIVRKVDGVYSARRATGSKRSIRNDGGK